MKLVRGGQGRSRKDMEDSALLFAIAVAGSVLTLALAIVWHVLK